MKRKKKDTQNSKRFKIDAGLPVGVRGGQYVFQWRIRGGGGW